MHRTITWSFDVGIARSWSRWNQKSENFNIKASVSLNFYCFFNYTICRVLSVDWHIWYQIWCLGWLSGLYQVRYWSKDLDFLSVHVNMEIAGLTACTVITYYRYMLFWFRTTITCMLICLVMIPVTHDRRVHYLCPLFTINMHIHLHNSRTQSVKRVYYLFVTYSS